MNTNLGLRAGIDWPILIIEHVSEIIGLCANSSFSSSDGTSPSSSSHDKNSNESLSELFIGDIAYDSCRAPFGCYAS